MVVVQKKNQCCAYVTIKNCTPIFTTFVCHGFFSLLIQVMQVLNFRDVFFPVCLIIVTAPSDIRHLMQTPNVFSSSFDNVKKTLLLNLRSKEFVNTNAKITYGMNFWYSSSHVRSKLSDQITEQRVFWGSWLH